MVIETRRNSVGIFIYTLSETTKVLRPIALDSSTLRQLVGGTFYAFIASCLVYALDEEKIRPFFFSEKNP